MVAVAVQRVVVVVVVEVMYGGRGRRMGVRFEGYVGVGARMGGLLVCDLESEG